MLSAKKKASIQFSPLDYETSVDIIIFFTEVAFNKLITDTGLLNKGDVFKIKTNFQMEEELVKLKFNFSLPYYFSFLEQKTKLLMYLNPLFSLSHSYKTKLNFSVSYKTDPTAADKGAGSQIPVAIDFDLFFSTGFLIYPNNLLLKRLTDILALEQFSFHKHFQRFKNFGPDDIMDLQIEAEKLLQLMEPRPVNILFYQDNAENMYVAISSNFLPDDVTKICHKFLLENSICDAGRQLIDEFNRVFSLNKFSNIHLLFQEKKPKVLEGNPSKSNKTRSRSI